MKFSQNIRFRISSGINSRVAVKHSNIYKGAEEAVSRQEKTFHHLISRARKTEYGISYDFNSISKIESFQNRIPINNYNHLKPFIERILNGAPNILWPGRTKWFAKSSGTTSDKSKFIPVSDDALYRCHFKAGREMITLVFANYPKTNIYYGNGLVLGGSHQINNFNQRSKVGDLSAILFQNLPYWTKLWQMPTRRTAFLADWEQKIDKIAREVVNKKITHITGVPTWTIVLFNKLLEISEKENILQIWPHLELYIHGGVNFKPYKELFNKYIPSDQMIYFETYNASEGFFGLQDRKDGNDLLLLTDHGIFYEFIPVDEIEKENCTVLTLDQVETNCNYALVISTNAGLWRYLIGDTIRFTSLSPFRFKLSGRTKNFINAFGEEVIIENAENAIAKACELTNSQIRDFTAAPLYFSEKGKGTHEWVIEFIKYPSDIENFTILLDKSLQELNSDYEAKRFKNMALTLPKVHVTKQGTFYDWMKKRGKLGGQNKVPRLFNDRQYLDDILDFIKKTN